MRKTICAIMTLMLCAAAFGRDIAISDLSITRNSIAYKSDFSQVAVNTPRTETRLTARREAIEIDATLERTVIGVDGSTIIAYSGSTLYKTAISAFSTAGTSWTTLVNVASDDSGGANVFAPYRNAGGAYITGLQVVGPGVWILGTCMGVAYDSDGHLFKTADSGATWTHILTMDCGYMPDWESMGQFGNTLIVGCYGGNPSNVGSPADSEGHDKVYLSDDLGNNWSEIYERNDYGTYGTDDPQAAGTHIHFCQMIDADNALVQFGDALPRIYGENNLLLKLTRASPAWTATVIRQFGENPVQGLRDNGYIYIGTDASFGPAVKRYNISTGLFESCIRWPNYVGTFNTETGVYTSVSAAPQRIHSGSINIFSIIKSGNTFYAACWGFTPLQMTGVIASNNGTDWVWVCRQAAPATVHTYYGVRYIRGVAGGYVWGTHYGTDATNRCFRMSIALFESKEFVRLEHSTTNLHPNLETTTTGYTPLHRCTNSARVTGASVGIIPVIGDYVYKIVCDKGDFGDWRDTIGVVLFPFIAESQVGDYMVASFWVKAAPGWHRKVLCEMRIEDSLGTTLGTQQSGVFTPTTDWQKITLWVKTLDVWGILAPRIAIWLKREGLAFGTATPYVVTDSEWRKCTLYVDALSMTYSATRHDSTSYQINGTARANEYATLDLTNYTDRDTIIFDWLPDTSSTELHDDIGICTLTDGATDLDVFYDQSEGKIAITDGVTTEGITCDFAKLDRIRIGITRLDTYIRLTVETTKYANTNLYPAQDIGEFTTLELGRTSAPIYGVGLYGNIKLFRELTEKEIFDGYESSVDRMGVFGPRRYLFGN